MFYILWFLAVESKNGRKVSIYEFKTPNLSQLQQEMQ